MLQRNECTDLDYQAPQGSLQTSVADILTEVLDVDKFGRTDSFYDFGGTSLQAIKICARIERDTGWHAEAVWLLESDTLQDFTALLEKEREHAGD